MSGLHFLLGSSVVLISFAPLLICVPIVVILASNREFRSRFVFLILIHISIADIGQLTLHLICGMQVICETTLFFCSSKVEDRQLALLFDMMFASIHFFVPVTCSRAIQIIAGQHAHFAFNMNMLIAGPIQIFLPGGVQLMVPDNTKEQWSVWFYVLSVVIVITTIFFVVFTSSKLADWAKPELGSAFDSKFTAFPWISQMATENHICKKNVS